MKIRDLMAVSFADFQDGVINLPALLEKLGEVRMCLIRSPGLARIEQSYKDTVDRFNEIRETIIYAQANLNSDGVVQTEVHLGSSPLRYDRISP